jgi:Fis family transcriptional regulator
MRTRCKTQAAVGHIAEAVAYSLDLYEQALHGIEPTDVHAMVLEEAERAALQWTMMMVGHNQSRAAEWLGVARPTLRAKLDLHGIRAPG